MTDRNDQSPFLRMFTAAVLAAPLMLVGCDRQDDYGISVNDVVTETDRYAGQEITVRGEVGEMLSDTAFALEDSDMEIAEIPVVPSDELVSRFTVREDEEVWLTGDLRVVAVSEVEAEYDFDLLEADTELEIEADTDMVPVLVASAGTY